MTNALPAARRNIEASADVTLHHLPSAALVLSSDESVEFANDAVRSLFNMLEPTGSTLEGV